MDFWVKKSGYLTTGWEGDFSIYPLYRLEFVPKINIVGTGIAWGWGTREASRVLGLGLSGGYGGEDT